jgi:Kef-type K+ transport system membrane component KefB
MVGDAGVLAPLLPALTVVLIVAHLLGALADRVGFVPVVGELLTGLVLGPSILGVLAPGVAALVVPVPVGLEVLSSLGLLLLLVLAGTEVDAAALEQSLRPTVALAAGAFVVPFAGGVALGYLLPARYLVAPELRGPFALLLGTALSISAVPVAVRVLVDLDAMDRPVGQLTLTAAVAVDAIGWIVLTVVFQLAREGGTDPLAVGRTVIVLAAFAGLVLAVGPTVARSVFAAASRVRSPVLTGFSAVVALGLGAAATAVALGLEAILGAFLAGVVVRPALDADSAHVFEVATLGLFAPLFFATAGLRVDLTGAVGPEVLAVGGVTLVVAVAGKAIGVAIGAAVTDLSAAETRCLAIGLNARGAMEIVVAALGLSVGLFSPVMYAVVVLVAVLTSVMTPPLLRRALARVPDPTTDSSGEPAATPPGDQ